MLRKLIDENGVNEAQKIMVNAWLALHMGLGTNGDQRIEFDGNYGPVARYCDGNLDRILREEMPCPNDWVLDHLQHHVSERLTLDLGDLAPDGFRRSDMQEALKLHRQFMEIGEMPALASGDPRPTEKPRETYPEVD